MALSLPWPALKAGYPTPTVATRSGLPDLSGVELDDEPTSGAGTEVRDLFIERGAELSAVYPEPPFGLVVGVATDAGRRQRNEDAHGVFSAESAFVLADGMGGHRGGAVASSLAIDAVARCLQGIQVPSGVSPHLLRRLPRGAIRLLDAFAAANEAVRRMTLHNPRLGEMGTTLVAAHVDGATRRLSVAHVGDSRCYRLRRGKLTQVTRDHADAAGRGLTRAIGRRGLVEADVSILSVEEGDVILLSSDGLAIASKDIREVLAHAESPQACADELVARANAAGGRDNVTTLVVRVSASK